MENKVDETSYCFLVFANKYEKGDHMKNKENQGSLDGHNMSMEQMKDGNNLSNTSLISGILSAITFMIPFISIPLLIVAIINGITFMRRHGKGIGAILGIIIGSAVLLFQLLGIIDFIFTKPYVIN